MARGDGSLFRPKGSRNFWTRIYIPYEQRTWRETTGTSELKAARDILRERRLSVQRRQPIRATELRFEAAAELIVADYVSNGRRSLRTLVQTRLPHLARAFGGQRLRDITAAQVDRQKTTWLKDVTAPMAPQSINHLLATLKRIFKLAVEQGYPQFLVPTIRLLKIRNARKGFFEPGEFLAVRAHLAEPLRSIVDVAYFTGWRVPSEIAMMRRSAVDFENGWLRLEPDATKTGAGRLFPLLPQLRDVLMERISAVAQLESDIEKPIPWIFVHLQNRSRGRAGQPYRINSHAYRMWKAACDAAGISGRIFHDFRRTAYRNLVMARIPPQIARAWVGYETEAMERRYKTGDEALFSTFAGQLADHYSGSLRQPVLTQSLAQPIDKEEGGERIRTVEWRFCRPLP